MDVTAIFDIGKTNKKFFLFDSNYQEVYCSYVQFNEIEDDDGFPCDDIYAMADWIKTTFQQTLKDPTFHLKSVNFSAYGASFVHINKDGKVLTPLYNYLKPYPKELLQSFHQKYGDTLKIAAETASPPLGMLNSGMQLYWLKYAKPEIFKQIRWSLHLPQYLAYLLHGTPLSDYTSIGCHTMLWNYEKQDYHHWVYAEGIDQVLAPIVPTNTTIDKQLLDQEYKVGVGIHDSSAALLPYIRINKDPFLLLSTGTWSISLNPFNEEILTPEALTQDCLNFLSIEGTGIKAARLFLGNEYQIWINKLSNHFNQTIGKHKSIQPDPIILEKLNTFPKHTFKWESIPSQFASSQETDLNQFKTYETAYHKLMHELTQLQVNSIQLALGNNDIDQLYIDGGFLDNQLFLYFLKQAFSDANLIASKKPLGSAIGAAIVIDNPELVSIKLMENFNLREGSDEVIK